MALWVRLRVRLRVEQCWTVVELVLVCMDVRRSSLSSRRAYYMSLGMAVQDCAQIASLASSLSVRRGLRSQRFVRADAVAQIAPSIARRSRRDAHILRPPISPDPLLLHVSNPA